jgi:hypothetical protein
MEGGTISGNNTSNSGGGVFVASGGRFTMLNGSVSFNTAGGSGGGVLVDGIFNMIGGMISGNSANNGDGGGVHISSHATLTKTGGTITGNDAGSMGNVTSSNRGHAAFRSVSPNLWRNITAGPTDNPENYGFWRNEP